jgi:AcrR family transcriptional regulator
MATTRTGAGKRKRRASGRPAGGSDGIVAAVFAATNRLLVREGYARLSVDAVATAAGVNKTSIYRRWKTKAELVLAAIQRPACVEEFHPSGDLRADLIALIRVKLDQLSTPEARAIAIALSSIADDAAMAATFRQRRYRLSMEVVEQAIARGDLPAATDAGLVSEMLLAPVLMRLLVTHEAVDDAFVERVVDQVLAAFPAGKPGVGQGGRTPSGP